MDINLKVNGNSIHIGMTREQLLQAGIHKAGFFIRRMLRKIPENTGDVLWIKNPTIQCFDDVSTKIIPQSSSAATLDDICATSVFIFLKNGRACYGMLQVFKSINLASCFAYHFRCRAFGNFGDCRCSQPILIPVSISDQTGCRDVLLSTWEDKSSHVVCRLDYRGSTCVVQWGNGGIPSYMVNQLINVGTTIDEISDFRARIEKDLSEVIDAITSFKTRQQK